MMILSACAGKEPEPEKGEKILSSFGGTPYGASTAENSDRIKDLASKVEELEKEISVLRNDNKEIKENYKGILALLGEYQKALSNVRNRLKAMAEGVDSYVAAEKAYLYSSPDASSERKLELERGETVSVIEGIPGAEMWIKVITGELEGYMDGRVVLPLGK
ncbi:hypothetical protein [Limisalsivibrio acetivorans]|uniref:hypothetical protein n=1 Tax=Limisalsivibrio acetivorans TaxID=1304888 RepID=UPI00138ABCE6|nr:hypothetical protein [Limisalsivibrio acetivorans]